MGFSVAPKLPSANISIVLRHGLLILIASLALAGCRKTVNIGGGYSISAASSPDGQTHGNSLEFNGIHIIDNISLYQVHDDFIVFIGYISEGSLDNEQVFVCKAAGTPVLITQHVVGHASEIKDPLNNKPVSILNVENLSATAQGVSVQIYVGESHTGKRQVETHDLTWAEVQSLYTQGQTAPLEKSSSGDYRILR